MYSLKSRNILLHRPRQRQRGISLIELLVGIAIGIAVITAALGVLLLSRFTSGSVSDLSQLQQQGSYALRVIGAQLRQTGSIVVGTSTAMPGSFEYTNTNVALNAGDSAVVSGVEGGSSTPDRFTVGNLPNNNLSTQQRNCLGQDASLGARMDSTFYVSNGQLYCQTISKLGQQQQALITNVSDMQVIYRVQNSGNIQFLNADQITKNNAWNAITAIEVCLDLQGNESTNVNVGTYQNCRDQSIPRNGYLHLVLRNVFNLRTQKGAA
jgi:type IV pilus assembly protein PilW